MEKIVEGKQRYYVLDGHKPVACDLLTWARSQESGDARRVAEDFINDSWISTVFLGLDHSFFQGPALVFETMIFDGPHDGHLERCSTWDEAVETHKRACALVDDGDA